MAINYDGGNYTVDWPALSLASEDVYRQAIAAQEEAISKAISQMFTTYAGVAFGPRPIPAPPPDPRAERARTRREIDAVLTEDARQHPAFAVARKSALLAEYERPVDRQDGRDAGRILRSLRLYEEERGSGRRPNALAVERWAGCFHADTLAAYERARAIGQEAAR